MEKILINPSKERTIIDFRQFGFNDVLVLGRYIYRSTHPPLESHNQQELLEFSFLAQGRQTFCIENETYFVKGGEIIAVFPHETHGSGTYGEEKGVMYWMLIKPPNNKSGFLGTSPEEAQVLWNALLTIPNRVFTANHNAQKYLETVLTIASDLLNDDADPDSIMENQKVLNADRNRKSKRLKKLYQYHSNGNYATDTIPEKMESQFQTKNIFEILKIRTLLLSYLLDIVRGDNLQSKIKSEKVQLLIDWFENHMDRMLSINEMAKLAGISISSLIKKFKLELGITPGDYQMRHKVERSLDMLCDMDLNITDIAYGLGFSSTQYFATVFKRYMLMSPTAYRKHIIQTANGKLY